MKNLITNRKLSIETLFLVLSLSKHIHKFLQEFHHQSQRHFFFQSVKLQELYGHFLLSSMTNQTHQ